MLIVLPNYRFSLSICLFPSLSPSHIRQNLILPKLLLFSVSALSVWVVNNGNNSWVRVWRSGRSAFITAHHTGLFQTVSMETEQGGSNSALTVYVTTQLSRSLSSCPFLLYLASQWEWVEWGVAGILGMSAIAMQWEPKLKIPIDT